MNYLTYGDSAGKAVLFLHGLAASAESCYLPIVDALAQAGYRIVLAEIDGHSSRAPGDLASLSACCDDVEAYVNRELGGKLHCLSGFSMGATMAVEIAGRGKLAIDRLHLDAPVLSEMGPAAPLFTFMFSRGALAFEKGKRPPQFLLDWAMGKGNDSVIEMLYPRTSKATLENACTWLYHYKIPQNLHGFSGPVAAWRGEREPFPAHSINLLRPYLPQLQERVFPGLGHGQQLHEHPRDYERDLLAFLK